MAKGRQDARPHKIVDLLDVVRAKVSAHEVLDSRHAFQRMTERRITFLEVLDVLRTGFHEKKKDQYKPEYDDWNYSIRGKTLDGRELRIVVALTEEGLLVITAIDLDA